MDATTEFTKKFGRVFILMGHKLVNDGELGSNMGGYLVRIMHITMLEDAAQRDQLVDALVNDMLVDFNLNTLVDLSLCN